MRGREGGALVATLLKHWKKFAFKVDCHRSVTPCRCSMTDMRVKFEHLRIRFTGYACRFDSLSRGEWISAILLQASFPQKDVRCHKALSRSLGGCF
jgi:hypothetical protein